jgi:hypothetical protein
MPGFRKSMRAYEDWLRAAVAPDFVETDLKEKHRKMRASAFAFLRATYWRWAETALEISPELADGPVVLAIGDLHLENFGTWRDVEGRLVWGVNDFDDAAAMPCALDLVRLAASAFLARGRKGPGMTGICGAILAGYRKGLENPAPVILDRDRKWLRKAVMLPETERAAFWARYKRLRPCDPPQRFRAALQSALPETDEAPVMSARSAGTGSLGRPRFVAHADWRGGPVLREAKALVQSAWSLHHAPGDTAIRAGEAAVGPFRAPDPHYRVADGILVRRLSPNARKIEVKRDADTLLDRDMLEMMGLEIANCHGGDAGLRQAIGEDIARRSRTWLRNAARAAVDGVVREHGELD